MKFLIIDEDDHLGKVMVETIQKRGIDVVILQTRDFKSPKIGVEKHKDFNPTHIIFHPSYMGRGEASSLVKFIKALWPDAKLLVDSESEVGMEVADEVLGRFSLIHWIGENVQILPIVKT